MKEFLLTERKEKNKKTGLSSLTKLMQSPARLFDSDQFSLGPPLSRARATFDLHDSRTSRQT